MINFKRLALTVTEIKSDEAKKILINTFTSPSKRRNKKFWIKTDLHLTQ